MGKINVAIITGGKNTEHEVSLVSAWNIYKGLDKKKYNVFILGIDKKGIWRFGKNENFWHDPGKVKNTKIDPKTKKVAIVRKNKNVNVIDIEIAKTLARIDVFFPIIHGAYGEDGCLQGMLEMLNAAYVGPGVMASAACMDKDVMKRILHEAGIATADAFVLRKKKLNRKDYEEIIKELGLPLFVKPARQGSSVGVEKALSLDDLKKSVMNAFKYDSKVLVEQAIKGREIECSVMGNKKPVASTPGEIMLNSDFYSYSAKYLEEDAAIPVPKAKLTAPERRIIRELAVMVYKVLECEGMARVDFFIREDGEVFVNEVNTLPGFTNISMFPKMFEASGVKYEELLNKLIDFAIERKLSNEDKGLV